MILKQECITLDLAKKMKVVGIIQNSPAYWVNCEHCYNDKWELTNKKHNNANNVAAFTNTFLGLVLAESVGYLPEINKLNMVWSFVKYPYNHYFDGSEANVRAESILTLLEDKRFTLDQINEVFFKVLESY